MYTNTAHTDWDEHVPHVIFAYNTAVQDTTQMRPFKLVYGRDPILPSEVQLNKEIETNEAKRTLKYIQEARGLSKRRIENKQVKDKSRYDGKHRAVEYTVGDQVKVYTSRRQIGNIE